MTSSKCGVGVFHQTKLKRILTVDFPAPVGPITLVLWFHEQHTASKQSQPRTESLHPPAVQPRRVLLWHCLTSGTYWRPTGTSRPPRPGFYWGCAADMLACGYTWLIAMAVDAPPAMHCGLIRPIALRQPSMKLIRRS